MCINQQNMQEISVFRSNILMPQLSLEVICLSFCRDTALEILALRQQGKDFCLVSRQKSCASILQDLIGTSILADSDLSEQPYIIQCPEAL